MPHRSPHPIERESYRILRALVDLPALGLGPLSCAVAERVIHASADLGYATDLVLNEGALTRGLAALRGGVPVVVDARMVAAGITRLPTRCALDLDQTASDPTASDPAARDPAASATTRAAAGIRAAARQVGPGAIWVIGCAPTALVELLDLRPDPSLVIGLPVGFVGAVEAKHALAASGLPAVTNRSPKGGSAVAAAALNALLYLDLDLDLDFDNDLEPLEPEGEP
ncbi:MAG TPA: precorrin-8X methylmutase [Actinomycetota bacterium]